MEKIRTGTIRRRRTIAVLMAGLVLGMAMTATPAGAHFVPTIKHIWKHIKPRADARYVNNNEAVRVASTLGADLNLGDTAGATGTAATTSIKVPKRGVLVATATFEADLGNCCGDAAADLRFVRNGTALGPTWRHAWPLAQEINAVTVQHVMNVTPGTYTVGLQATVVAGFVNLDSPRVTVTWMRFGPTGGPASVVARPAARPAARSPGDH
jgi:hypothetical protein